MVQTDVEVAVQLAEPERRFHGDGRREQDGQVLKGESYPQNRAQHRIPSTNQPPDQHGRDAEQITRRVPGGGGDAWSKLEG